jgi:hypothetical protein
MKPLVFAAAVLISFAAAVFAQPRPAETSKQAGRSPQTVEARYEGGMFGFSKKENGFLRMDDENKRLIFLNKERKELFGLPYESLLALYPNSQSVTSTTGNVVRHIPLPGAGLAGLIKEKRRFMVVQFSDPDVAVNGTASFKIDNKEMLDSLMQTLAGKAGLTQRGDSYYRAGNSR